MDQPNVHMRRHNSLPANARSSSLLLRISNKFNPHVGTFRHAPPSNLASLPLHHRQQQQSHHHHSHRDLLLHKNSIYTLPSHHSSSPYVGTFRHAPASNTIMTQSFCWLETVVQELWKTSSVQNLSDVLMISGHLKGGNPFWTPEKRYTNNSQKTNNNKSAVSSVLVKLACWVLFGEPTPILSSPLYLQSNKTSSSSSDQSSCYSHSDSSSVSDGSDDDDSCMSSQHDSPLSHNTATTRMQDSLSNLTLISSQAEAYYAHTMVNKPEEHNHLDYTITQMDVIRMMRNASRHLNVESIVQLPVITYRAEDVIVEKTTTKANSQDATEILAGTNNVAPSSDAEMSWLFIDEGSATSQSYSAAATTTTTSTTKNHTASSLPEDDDDTNHVCVICLEHFVPGDRLRVLPCHHSFHVGCIDRWLSGSSSFDDCYTSGCPTCKKRPGVDDETANTNTNNTAVMDGSVPSWAFANIGNALAASQSE
jgi:hypothetical protein